MTETQETTKSQNESDLGNMKKAEAQINAAGKEAEKIYHDLKVKMAEFKDRFSEIFSEKTSTVEEGKKTAREVAYRARDAGTAVYHTVEENLIPVALIGAGAAWMITNLLRSGPESEPELEKHSEPESTIKETGARIGEKAKEVSHRAWEGSRRAGEKSKEIAMNNLLYVGGALLTMGVLIGLALPNTRREKRLYDEMREELME